MISVCMAFFNGQEYLDEQVGSILKQLRKGDELIISDDGSCPEAASLLRSILEKDSRVVLVEGPCEGLIRNFENALNQARGKYIFLSDQDDVWLDGKVKRMLEVLETSTLVVSDCRVTDEKLDLLYESFFAVNRSKAGLFNNVYSNSYLGCCMAFNRELLDVALPFPKSIPMHDWWLGLVAECHFNVSLIPDILLEYRRHGGNASPTSEKSKSSLLTKLCYRYNLVSNLLILKRN